MIRIVYFNLILLLLVNFSLENEYPEENPLDYGNLNIQQQIMNLQAAQRSINKKNEDISDAQYSKSNSKTIPLQLKEDYKFVDNWPASSKKLGAVSAVALDVYKNVVVFHRSDRIWNAETFDPQNIFKQRNLGPIKENTIITFDRDQGNVINEWGSNLFYMPHGLHINGNYYYITDVALHQVFRFNIKNSTRKPDLVLGDPFKPSMTSKTFCKPTSVVQLENGDFFVADGYCNARIIKFNFKGEKILEWGRNSFSGEISTGAEPPNNFAIPHALTLVPSKELLCVADRENGRIQCFSWSDGKFFSQYHSKIVGDRLFSVDYANDSLFVVNGPDVRNRDVAGYIFDINSGEVSGKFGSFLDPHDIAVTPDAREIYVGDLSPDNTGSRIHKYLLNGIKPTITREGDSINTVPSTKLPMRHGETALIVGSIVLLFAVFTVGIAILISKRKRRGNEVDNEYHSLMTK